MEKSDMKARIEQVVQETKNDYRLREKKLKKLLKEAENQEDLFAHGRINLLLAACNFTLGKRSGILPHAVKAVDVFKKLNNRSVLASCYNVLGISYVAQGNFYRAIECYYHALESNRGLKKPMIRNDVILNNIAESYYHMGEYQKSSVLLVRAMKSIRSKHPEDHVSVVIYSINLSDDYESLGQFDKALAVLESTAPDTEVMDYDVLLWGYYFRRCCVLYKLGRLEEAQKYADLGINSLKNGYDSYEFHRDLEKIAMQEIALGDFARAQSFADVLTEYAEKNGYTIDLIVSKRVQGSICRARGEVKEALAFYRELSELYEKRIAEQHEMQYECQKSAENASKEIGKLLHKIRSSQEKAERDALTGLMNRSALVRTTNEFISNAKEKGRTLGAIFMDIDYFKEYNDTYGHAQGDEAIKFVASVCLGEENASVRFFRYGGDEYFGIVIGYEDEELEQLAFRITETVRSSGFKHEKNPNGHRLTLSVGVVNVNMQESEATIIDIIQYADKTLYHAKGRGKNAVFACRILTETEHEYRRIMGK